MSKKLTLERVLKLLETDHAGRKTIDVLCHGNLSLRRDDLGFWSVVHEMQGLNCCPRTRDFASAMQAYIEELEKAGWFTYEKEDAESEVEAEKLDSGDVGLLVQIASKLADIYAHGTRFPIHLLVDKDTKVRLEAGRSHSSAIHPLPHGAWFVAHQTPSGMPVSTECHDLSGAIRAYKAQVAIAVEAKKSAERFIIQESDSLDIWKDVVAYPGAHSAIDSASAHHKNKPRMSHRVFDRVRGKVICLMYPIKDEEKAAS